MKKGLFSIFLAATLGVGFLYAQTLGILQPQTVGALTASSITSTGVLLGPDGTVTAPGYSFANATGMGMYKSGSNLALAAGGAVALTMVPNGQMTVGGNGVLSVGNGGVILFGGRAQIRDGGVDALLNFANAANSIGVGLDFATDGTLKIRNRAQAADVTLEAATLSLTARAQMVSPADGLWQVQNSAATFGVELNGGTAAPTLGTCTGGAITAGSRNVSGEVTGNTSGSCIINFGAPNWTNTPFCVANDETALIAVRISARSASSITVTGAGNGDAFQWMCLGRF